MTAAVGSQRRALEIAGVARSTWHYRTRPRERVADPVPQKERAYPSRISETDRAVIAGRITAGWAEGHAVDHSFASAWDDGVMLASRRDATQQAYYDKHPERFRRPPHTPAPADIVGINLPKPTDDAKAEPERLHAA